MTRPEEVRGGTQGTLREGAVCDAEEGMSWYAGEGKYCTVCRWDEWDGMGWVGQEGKYG